MMIFRLTCLLALTLCLYDCSRDSEPADSEYKRSLLLFGTIIEITLYDIDESQAENAFDQMEADFSRWHQNWNPWTDGELAQLNLRLAAGEPFTVDTELRELINAGAKLSALSGSLFNPAIGNLINLWQFHRSEEADIKPPEAGAIRHLVEQQPSMKDLHINGNSISSTNNSTQLSLGAFAKGYAIELSLNKLQSMGIKNAVINAGGDLKVIGHHGDRDWRVGIRHPRKQVVLGWLEAHPGESVFTSGDYERFYMYEGKRMHHILDPRTGYPAEGLSSVTVICADAGLADAAATALFVAGPEHWAETAHVMGIEYALLVDDTGNIQISPAMAARIHFMTGDDANTILSQPL